MLPIERQQTILKLIREEKSISCKNLSQLLNVSVSTIRNDLRFLETQGELSRLYGGAILPENDFTTAVSKREMTNFEAKEKIGRKAAELVHDGDIIFMDGSSTAIIMSRFLKAKKDLTIITNAQRIELEFAECRNVQLISVGGRFRSKNMTYIGGVARNTILENYFAGKFFFSCLGVAINVGLLDSNESEFDIKRAMAEVSDQSIFLCDSSKFGKMGFLKLMDFQSIHKVVTDKPLSAEWMAEFARYNIEVLIAD